MDKLEILLKDSFLLSIKRKIEKIFYSIDADDIESSYYYSVWKASEKFAPDKKIKFTTFFYSIFIKECMNLLKKKRIKTKSLKKDILKIESDINTYLIDSNEKDKNLILDRFLSKKTLRELSNENNCSLEGIRKKIINLVKKLKD